jgi:hypothetical protein
VDSANKVWTGFEVHSRYDDDGRCSDVFVAVIILDSLGIELSSSSRELLPSLVLLDFSTVPGFIPHLGDLVALYPSCFCNSPPTYRYSVPD